MPSLFEDYEQQYAVITAEVTSDIGKLKRISGSESRPGHIILKSTFNIQIY